MVKLMLEGFGGDGRKKNKGVVPDDFGIECYHVNSRYSQSLEDIGVFQGGKLFLILYYCLQAIWLRFRHGVRVFYYVPAPGKSVALYRDWLTMLICRPFFNKMVLHWHAAGLAKWLETSVQIRSRAMTYRLFKPVDLSIVLSRYNFADAEKLLSRQIRIVSNGVPDPCPGFEQSIMPRRRARFHSRLKLFAGQELSPEEIRDAAGDPQIVKVLYLAHCTRDKGLFATMEAVAVVNRELTARQSPLRFSLIIGGNFISDEDKQQFDRLVNTPGLGDSIHYLGFISGEQKDRALQDADLFCFPTRYLGENQPVNLIEAMAFGLPIITTRWRSLPEMLPPDYPGLVSTQSPEEIAAALLALSLNRSGELLRKNFLDQFTVEKHLSHLADAIHSVG